MDSDTTAVDDILETIKLWDHAVASAKSSNRDFSTRQLIDHMEGLRDKYGE